MKTQQEKLDLLEETCKIYNTNNRAVSGYNCTYNSDIYPFGCAVGRLIEEDSIRKSLPSKGIRHPSVWDFLPNYVKEYGKAFLFELQKLHDDNSYWNEQGLTEAGKKNVELIKSMILSNFI